MNLPEPTLLKIFLYLDTKNLTKAATVCKQWERISCDEQLWKQRFREDFRPKFQPNNDNGANFRSWYEEYKKLALETPKHLCQTVSLHFKEVLRIHFSKDGSLLISVSKDLRAGIWEVSTETEIPLKLLHELKLAEDFNLPWTYPKYAQLSPDKNLLLLSGRCCANNIGNVAIFDIRKLIGKSKKIGPKVRLLEVCVVPPLHACSQWIDDTSVLLSHVQPVSGTHFRQIFTVRRPPSVEKRVLFSVNRQSVAELFSLSRFIPNRFYRGNPGDRLLMYSTPAMNPPHYRRVVAFHFIAAERFSRLLENTEESSVNSAQIEAVMDETPDFEVDVQGYIIGLKLNADETVLSVNIREYLTEDDSSSLSNLSPESEVRLLDLRTLTLYSEKYPGAKAPKYRKITKYADSTDAHIASGSADNNAYIWSRIYGSLLGKLGHQGVVDCAAFNPTDPEMLITASDDRSIKVWKSKRKIVAAAEAAQKSGSFFKR